MRILQVCTAFGHGGIQRHVIGLSESLRGHGHDVFLAGSSGPWLNRLNGFECLPLDLVEVSTEGGNAINRLARVFKCALKLRSFIRKNRIDLIHAHESAPAIVAKFASLGLGIPILLTYHGSEPERVRYFGLIGRLTSQRIVTPSHRCAQDLCERARVPRENVHVIGLGIQPAPVYEQSRIDKHREKILGSDGKLLVVTVARLSHQKGIDVLVEVSRLVKAARRGIRFVVIGDGQLRSKAREWSANADVESVLHFDGESNEPYLYLAAADIFLLTSRWEALPISIVEAFRAGLPVIATDCGGVGELVSPDVGRLCAVEDVDTLSAAVLELADSADLREKLGQGARALSAQSRFSPDHVHRQFEEIYAEMIGAGRK